MLLTELNMNLIPVNLMLVILLLALGAILKHCTGDWVVNRVIPVILMLISVAVEFCLKYSVFRENPSAESVLTIVVTGLASAILAIGLHSSGKNIFCNGAFVAFFTGKYDNVLEAGLDQVLSMNLKNDTAEVKEVPIGFKAEEAVSIWNQAIERADSEEINAQIEEALEQMNEETAQEEQLDLEEVVEEKMEEFSEQVSEEECNHQSPEE